MYDGLDYDGLDKNYRKRKHLKSPGIEELLSKEHVTEQEPCSLCLGDAFYEKLHEMLLFASLPGGRSRN